MTVRIPVASLKDVRKFYRTSDGKTVEALKGITFEAAPEERLTALIGPDGAGKSTLLKLLCGLEAADAGMVRSLGSSPDPDDPELLKRIAYMPQSLGLYRELSCRENMELQAELRGIPAAEAGEKIRELLVLTGLGPFMERPAGKLSGGMKQKLALAAALLASPDLLLLDEPTVGVDPLSRRELWNVLKERRKARDMAVVFSTAYLEEAEAADNVILLEEGEIIARGSPQSLMEAACGRTFTYALDGLEPEESERIKRRFMLTASASDASSPWLDAVPREGRMDLLLIPGRTPELPDDIDRGRLSPRPPRLKDAYALLTFKDEPGADSTLASMEARPMKVGGGTAHGKGTEKPLVIARGIRRVFGNFVAVDDTTFDVKPGEIFGILGPNGAGKTTTFRMLASLLPASDGEIDIAGANLKSSKSLARSLVGYVAQKFSLYAKLSVRENLRFFGRSFGLSGEALKVRIDDLLREFRLAEKADFQAGSLSLGAQKDLSIACGFIHNPKIIFLDEATSGADIAQRRALWRRIVRFAARGAAVVVTTHFMEEAEYCDRFLIQDAGKIIAIGTPAEIREAAFGNEKAESASIESAFIEIVERKRLEREKGGRE
ncbi:ABC transporter ATP-binding protein [Sutterella seckii]|uniref:ABC transporter ATP-binding protein n=1 Tax=Sutterella seckii TaxID=1944635 RepID=A0AAI9SBN4_9BURK|nr:ATP-binding cassette domain-containing protein [Sutterella seckii]KAB7651018.1 ABC transporter ATP-binding protein [Sutterella seckii]